MFRISTITLFKQHPKLFLPSQIRTMATKSPGSNPLEVIKKGCLQRNLCDEHGYRRPGMHWTFSIAVSPDDPTQVRWLMDSSILGSLKNEKPYYIVSSFCQIMILTTTFCSIGSFIHSFIRSFVSAPQFENGWCPTSLGRWN